MGNSCDFRVPQSSQDNKQKPQTKVPSFEMPLLANNPKPRIILGTMTFGPDTSTGARITSLDEYNTFLDHFQAAGYGEIDTARSYVGGKQEAFTREARWKERGLTLATKVYPDKPGKHAPAVLAEHFNTSLKELGADCVDIFYLHAADRSIPFAETLEAVNKLHKEGKFVQLGLSNFTAFEVAEVVMTCKYNNWVRPTIYQGMYNAITRSLVVCLVENTSQKTFLLREGTVMPLAEWARCTESATSKTPPSMRSRSLSLLSKSTA